MEVGLSHGHRDHGGRWLNLQTLGPHSQLQGWMGPGHLLFNSPGSPRGTFSDWDFSESSEKRWESPRLGLAPGGPRGAACGPVSRTPSSSSSAHRRRGRVLGISYCEDFFLGLGPGPPAPRRAGPCGWCRAFPLTPTSAQAPPRAPPELRGRICPHAFHGSRCVSLGPLCLPACCALWGLGQQRWAVSGPALGD